MTAVGRLATTASSDEFSALEDNLTAIPLDTPHGAPATPFEAAKRCKSESAVDADHPRDSTPPRVHKAASGDLPEEAPSPGLRDGPVISELLRPAASASDITRLPEPADPHKFAEKPHADTGATFPRRPPTVPEDGDAPCTAERVAFFDLDLTLLDINTGRSWVEKEFKEGKVPLQVFLLAMFWFAKYAAGLGVDASEVACEAMALYKGACSAQMAKEVETWWEDNCVFRLRPKAREALAMHKKRGERCVLCTASWQHVAAMAKRSFQMDDVICSIIEEGADGCFTGVVTDAYGDNKWARTTEWAKRERVDLANCYFYTDSVSDRKLLEYVGKPVCVCPDSKLAALATKNGWPVEEWGDAAIPSDRKLHRYCTVWGIKL